jgi:hypothetical protein
MMRPSTGPLASHRRRRCPNDRHHGFCVPIQGQALRHLTSECAIVAIANGSAAGVTVMG